MSLVKCKCGKYTNNGLLCTGCQRDSSIDVAYYSPEDELEEEELDEYGFIIVDELDYNPIDEDD